MKWLTHCLRQQAGSHKETRVGLLDTPHIFPVGSEFIRENGFG